jgi:radical SAM protein with 4Fe4S-binding SPASM domain
LRRQAPQDARYLALSFGCALKRLEEPCLYDARSDDLYELNEEAAACLSRCDGTRTLEELAPEPKFLEFCLEEGLLDLLPTSQIRRQPPLIQSPLPSLRYLEVQLTGRCNLRCRHCYLGEPQAVDLPLEAALTALAELEETAGLRVMLSGGEPLAWPQLSALNERLGEFALRFVLLTNATLLTRELAERLAVHEVQVSLDGLERGHDLLRGTGGYRRALAGLEAARTSGKQVSVATMLHPANLSEMDGLARLIDELGVREWGIDVPVRFGRLAQDEALWLSPEEAAPYLSLAFGGSYHGGSEGYGCGLHLATLSPKGNLLKCGFYEQPLGRLEEGLRVCWERLAPLPLSEIAECAGCEHADVCGGGCRYRAGSPQGRDPYMCALHGLR